MKLSGNEKGKAVKSVFPFAIGLKIHKQLFATVLSLVALSFVAISLNVHYVSEVALVYMKLFF